MVLLCQKVMVSVCNETIWHTDPLPLRLRGFWFGGEKKSITEVEWAQSSAKLGFMVVIAHVSYTFEQHDEARKEMCLVKFKEAQRTKIHHAAGEPFCPFKRHSHVINWVWFTESHHLIHQPDIMPKHVVDPPVHERIAGQYHVLPHQIVNITCTN